MYKSVSIILGLLASHTSFGEEASEGGKSTEEVFVIADQLFADTSLVSPSSKITAEQLKSLNIVTVEDALAYEPSVVIRRRYIGDPNGVVGIRGSGMFQTTRTMAFADGLPLHYLLQTRWSGAPRWSLVSSGEIQTAEVIYGPYSAEYSGNAMGGVIDIQTRTPTDREVRVEGTLFSQQYDHFGTDESFNGHKLFASFEDRIGDFSLFASINHLDNDSQPMTNYSVPEDERDTLEDDNVSGHFDSRSDRGDDIIVIGDSGAEHSVSDLYKLKLGYDFEHTQLRGTVAYEDRERDETDHNNYLLDPNGSTYWDLGNRNYQQRFQERDSLLVGLGVSGKLGAEWVYDVYGTRFEIVKDEEFRTGLNPQDPVYQQAQEDLANGVPDDEREVVQGRVTEYGDTGWETLDIKFGTQSLLGDDTMRLSVGLYADAYQLEIKPRNVDSLTGEQISERRASGGKTETRAIFTQWGWDLSDRWDIALGLRQEYWEAIDGFLGDVQAEDRSESATSPKFSLGYDTSPSTRVRYSLAKATRFPIVEELYANESSSTNLVQSDPDLQPEEGVFHNLSFEYDIEQGLININLFYDLIEDTIYNQTGTIIDGTVNTSITTFLAIDEVETQGIEFIYNQENLFNLPVDVRFNLAYTDATITENTVNPDIEGNVLPRLPEWRANMMLAYDATQDIQLSTSFHYASDAFADLDNLDEEDNVFGAIDRYFFVSAKANWDANDNFTVSLGVDNLFDELAYVAHPWPSRTFFLEAKYRYH